MVNFGLWKYVDSVFLSFVFFIKCFFDFKSIDNWCNLDDIGNVNE